MKILRILAVIIILLAIVYVYPPLRLSAWVALGRSPVCPYARAVESDRNLRRQIEFKDQILKASHKLQTDPTGFEQWQTPKAIYWIPKGSHYVLPFNLAEQERKIYGTGVRAVHKDDVVLDCGANIGVFTREALDDGARLVVAIEPASENIECLRRNFRDEIAAGRVVIYPKGVWDKDDFLTLNVDPNNSAADSFIIHRDGAQGVERVPLTTIDKMVDELKLERVDYIKMDIEGAEVKALDGGHNTIAKFHPRMSLSVYHAPDHPVEVPAAARRGWAGYQIECGPCAEANYAIRPDVLYFF